MNFGKNLRNKIFFLGLCLILIGLFIYFSNRNKTVEVVPQLSPSPTLSLSQISYAKVTRVIDGDTIQIEGGQKVRYIGMDTTEIYPKVECYSEEAKKENENLVLGKTVRLEKDVSETDKYGRLLRYVYIDDKFVNDELVRDGFAKIETVPPDIKHKDEFLFSQTYAKENNLGLWGKCF